MYGEVFCKVYNVLGWNYYPEAFGEKLLCWIEENHLDVKTALDLACGTGVLCRVLRDAGISAFGADLSEGMIAIARSENPDIPFTVADMVTYRPEERVDLVTCTGDSLNHIPSLADVERIFGNVYESLNPGGFFIFDLLNEKEVSNDEPFEFDYSDTLRVWFRMTRPTEQDIDLNIRIFEKGNLQTEEPTELFLQRNASIGIDYVICTTTLFLIIHLSSNAGTDLCFGGVITFHLA